jgi:hypothetical protein
VIKTPLVISDSVTFAHASAAAFVSNVRAICPNPFFLTKACQDPERLRNVAIVSLLFSDPSILLFLSTGDKRVTKTLFYFG